MLREKDIVLSVIEKVLEVIKNLTEEELIEIVEKKKEFALISTDKIEKNDKKKIKELSKKKKENIKKKQKDELPNEFDLYIRELSKFRSKEDAIKYLLDNKLTVTKLKILAKKLSIYIKSKSKKIDIINTIVDDIVGSMLKIEALREY